jgi:hypothetical protein
MAAYPERLLAPWRARVEQQAEELGALRERLAVATARLAELAAPTQAPGAQDGAAPRPGGRRRSWWRWLVWG